MGKKKNLSRDQKRKRKLAKKAAKSPKVNALAYQGNKYKSDELLPLVQETETGIYQAHVATNRRLTDRIVQAALEKLVLDLRKGPLPPLPETEVIQDVPGEEVDFIIGHIRRNWLNLSKSGFATTKENRIGVLRTLLNSINTWGSPGKESRGYLSFLEGFLKQLRVSGQAFETEGEFVDEGLDDEEQEDELLALGRDWHYDQDLDAAADFKDLAEERIREGDYQYVVNVCNQLIGETGGDMSMMPTLSLLSIRAQEAMGKREPTALEHHNEVNP
ncbi:MAG: hypothetical protein ACJ8FY_26635 [Gemmataceae bacterium]